MAKLHHAALSFTVVLAVTASPVAHAADLLGPDGIGPVKIGMTVRQAERVLGAKLKLTSAEDPSGKCLRGSRADGVDSGIIYMALEGAIQRVDVKLALAPGVMTRAGIGAGVGPDTVKNVYGAQARRDESDPNQDPASNDDLVVDTPDHKRGIQFKFEGGKLTWMIAGAYPALSYYEGCL
jgi:hypothetical protein